MSSANPAPLPIGARGQLHGWRMRIVARLVLAADFAGETYYWNEYVLAGESGGDGLLVHEEGESGPEWKLFRRFEPARPLSARAAAAKRTGDTVDLDGTPVRITLVGQSRVHHIEGPPPEGVGLGGIAHYFNADTGPRMLVASWTGDAIEFFEGRDVPGPLVAQAFGVPASAPAFAPPRSARAALGGLLQTSRSSLGTALVVFLLATVTMLAAFAFFVGKRKQTPVPVVAAPAAPPTTLATGAAGRLGVERFSVAGSGTVELARLAGRHRLREYQLDRENGAAWLLVQGLQGGRAEWHLFRPIAPPPEFATPFAAAAVRRLSWVTVDGEKLQVLDVFRAQAQPAETPAPALLPAGSVRYGFHGRTGRDVVLARWSETGLEVFRGVPFAESDVRTAFAPAAP